MEIDYTDLAIWFVFVFNILYLMAVAVSFCIKESQVFKPLKNRKRMHFDHLVLGGIGLFTLIALMIGIFLR